MLDTGLLVQDGVPTMDSADEAFLVVEGGPDSDETISLPGPTNTMGRQSTNDVVVSEAGVSRRHAEIVEDGGVHYLRDLSTTNGTFVNDESIGEADHPLNDGDSIRLAASKVQYVFHSPAANTLQLTLVQPTLEGSAEVSAPGSPQTLVTEVTDPQRPAAQLEPDELYEGTVRLRLDAGGDTGVVVNFTKQLSDTLEFRVLRMANNREGGVDLWLALRQPLSLRSVISALEGVTGVSPTRGRDLSPDSGDAPLTITLGSGEPPPSPPAD